MINILNEIQIKYNSASFHGWVSLPLRHQTSKQLHTDVVKACKLMMTMCCFVIGCGLLMQSLR